MEKIILRSTVIGDNTRTSKEDADIVAAVKSDFMSVAAATQSKQLAGIMNIDFYFNNQWTEDQVRDIKEQYRHPYVFNEVKDKVDHLVGTQQQTRLDVKVMPRERGDEGAAELLNAMVKWSEQSNEIDFIESAVFKDSLLTGIGVVSIRWDMSDIVYGYPKIERIPFNEFYWDGDSKNVTLDDCRWQGRVVNMRRSDASDLYPMHAAEIMGAPGIDSFSFNEFYGEKTTRQASLSGYGGAFSSSRDKEYVTLIEHFEKRRVIEYVVVDEIENKDIRFDILEEAEAYYEGIVTSYIERGEELINTDGSSMVALQEIRVDRVWHTILVGDRLLEHRETALPFLPFIVNFCNFQDGDYCGFVDQLIDPQILINRNFSQLDYAIGASAKAPVTFISQLLKPTDRASGHERVRRELSKQSPVMEVLNHDAIRFHGSQPVNPVLFENIRFGIDRIMNYSGGRNLMGRTESAAESGRAVIARAEAGGVARLPLFDNLRIWRKSLTERLIWYIKNLCEPGQILSVIGQDQDLQYYELDDGVLDTIREIRVNVIVDEAIKSESVRERQFRQLIEFAQVTGMGRELTPILVELSSIPATIKDKITGSMEIMQQFKQMQDAKEAESKLRRQVEDALKRKDMREALEQSNDMQEAQDKAEEKSVPLAIDNATKAKLKVEEALRQGGKLGDIVDAYNGIKGEGAGTTNAETTKAALS